MRTDAAETTDLGTDRFLAANPQGTEVLLEAHSGEIQEYFLYDTESHSSSRLFSKPYEAENTGIASGGPGLLASEDLSTIYIASDQRLTPEAPPATTGGGADGSYIYRYDVPSKTLSFVLAPGVGVQSLSPEGRYAYLVSEGRVEVPSFPGIRDQVFRYDSVEKSIECISCASPFDPEPKHGAGFTDDEDNPETKDATPSETVASANGDYVFFTTISALVPKDVDGEVEFKKEYVKERKPSPNIRLRAMCMSGASRGWTVAPPFRVV